MGVEEAKRLTVIREAVAGRLSTREGMRRTGLSRRQFLRHKRRYREHGPRGLLHAGRGRPSPRRLDEAIRQRVLALLEQPVALNDCHLRDLLEEEEGLRVSADTVRRLRLASGQPPKQRRRPTRYRRRREREAQVGAMVLVDGSPFAWLGEGQPMCTFVGAMDDASGEVLSLTLRDHEDLHGFTATLQEVVTRFGVPWTLYGDRAGILVRNDRHWTLEEQLEGRQRPSHFGLMLEELGIRYIAALSPQAKGRIERLWRTLQDRLAAELALASCVTHDQARAFLPGFLQRFNRRFSVSPRHARPAWRAVPRQLDRILACRYPRVVRLDNTVSIPGEMLQLPPGPGDRGYARCRVEVRELLDGRRLVFYQEHLLAQYPSPSGPFSLAPRGAARPNYASADPPPAIRPRPKPNKPARDSAAYRAAVLPSATHPFRRSYKTLPQP
jgi:transposase